MDNKIKRPKQRMLGGVCAAFAKILNLPVWVIRLIWIGLTITTFSWFIWVYIFFWFFWPSED